MKNLEKNIILLKDTPDEPGVYLLKDGTGNIFYIGKAKSLKKRLSSYFNNKNDGSKSVFLGGRTDSFEFIATENELEALILEETLIKKHRPRFNVRMKDDKSYPYIAVTDEEYPRIIYSRSINRKSHKYFGPYADSSAARNVLELAHNIFKIRRCAKKLPLKKNERPCINYQIGKCSGVCTGKISREEYISRVNEAANFIGGQTDEIIKRLKLQMDKYSSETLFEKAAEIRNIIFDIQRISQKQNVIASSAYDIDYIAVSVIEEEAVLLLFEFRSGALSGRKVFIYENTEFINEAEIYERFLFDHYAQNDSLPHKIILKDRLNSSQLFQKMLSDKKNKIRISSAKSDDERSVIKIMSKNIDLIRTERESKKILSDKSRALAELARVLNTTRMIRTMTCFDISNFQGKDSVASMSCFLNGYPDKKGYRKFKIRGYESANDPGMIHEAVSRYLQNIINESLELPDLIVIDGGPTQLTRAIEAASALKTDVMIISIAKRNEEIYTSPDAPPIVLPKESQALQIIQSIRDESHRFGVKYHREIRSRRIISSPFDKIKGIGKDKKALLLKNYGSAKNAALAEAEEIAVKLNISKEKAQKIKELLLSDNFN
ncbi:MAG TPA: excinuclease ABC subunit UvrC [Spirochaetota bacterium]|nr:excinuclease ABC subunit UvrC [Spirochaetota bacterium]